MYVCVYIYIYTHIYVYTHILSSSSPPSRPVQVKLAQPLKPEEVDDDSGSAFLHI